MNSKIALLVVASAAFLRLFFWAHSALGQPNVTFNCAVTEVPQVECEALFDLYKATNGKHWKADHNWLRARSVASWHGVVVTGGHVTQLALPANNLTGAIPDSLQNLSRLQVLNLADNALYMPLPDYFFTYKNLRTLDLSRNYFHGFWPSIEQKNEALQTLNIKRNGLRGPVPDSVKNLTHLAELDLSYNALSGVLSPFSGLSKLTHLSLSRNRFSGPIPPDIASLSRLYSLKLDRNFLTGPIPTELANMRNLAQLNLRNNALTGAISPAFARSITLRWLNLSANNLTGSVPFSGENLHRMNQLILHENQLYGDIEPLVRGARVGAEVSAYSNCFDTPSLFYSPNFRHMWGPQKDASLCNNSAK